MLGTAIELDHLIFWQTLLNIDHILYASDSWGSFSQFRLNAYRYYPVPYIEDTPPWCYMNSRYKIGESLGIAISSLLLIVIFATLNLEYT